MHRLDKLHVMFYRYPDNVYLELLWRTIKSKYEFLTKIKKGKEKIILWYDSR